MVSDTLEEEALCDALVSSVLLRFLDDRPSPTSLLDEDEDDDEEDEEDEEEEDEDVVGVVSTPAGLEMFMRIAGSMGWGRRRWRQRRHGGNDHHAIRRRCPPAGPWPGRRTVAGWRAWGAR